VKLKPGAVWPLFVVGILMVSFTVCGITVYASVTDGSYAVETDYYERAVRWDEIAREREESKRCAWVSDVEVRTASDGPAELALLLRDAQGEPIDAARVEVETFHHAHRNDAVMTTMNAQGDGRYTLAIENARAGLWQVRLRARTDDGVHLATHDVYSKSAATTGTAG